MSKKIIVIGGVAGGASFATRARRLDENAEIIMVEKSGYISFANCGLPYHIGDEIKDRKKLLVQTPESLKQRFNLDVRIHTEALSIDKLLHKVELFDKINNRKYFESYDELVIATGAAPITPQLPGIDNPSILTLRNIEDMDKIISWIKTNKPQSAVIIGAGFIGLELLEQLQPKVRTISLIQDSKQVLAPLDPEMAVIVEDEIRSKGVNLFLGERIVAFEKNEKTICLTSQGTRISADLVILAIGVKPEKNIAEKAGIIIGERGGIKVNEFLQTNVSNIWAIGDVIEVKNLVTGEFAPIPLAGPANRQGRQVADNIFGLKRPFTGAIGTAILRVFDIIAGTTGANEKTLKRLNMPYKATYLYPRSHAGYYPNSEELAIKLLIDNTGSRKLLGAQIVGKGGVDKRLDLFALAIKSSLTIDDLAQAELSYAPPFGSAKDPINLAGMLSQNILDSVVETITPEELSNNLDDNLFLLDVRDKNEIDAGKIPNAVWIPLNELRTRINEIPKDKIITTYCAAAQRSYIAYRILVQQGFKVKNLSGAFKTWKNYKSSKQE